MNTSKRQATRRRTSAARAAVTLIGTAAMLVGSEVGAAAATPTHLSASFSFPDTMCGFDGTTQLRFVDNFADRPDGSGYDAGQFVQTFTADDGRGVSISFDAGREDNLAPVSNSDGTTARVVVYSGHDMKIQAVQGPVLEQNTGLVEQTVVFDPTGDVISVSVHVLAGPNPNTSGTPDCNVIGPYLGS